MCVVKDFILKIIEYVRLEVASNFSIYEIVFFFNFGFWFFEWPVILIFELIWQFSIFGVSNNLKTKQNNKMFSRNFKCTVFVGLLFLSPHIFNKFFAKPVPKEPITQPQTLSKVFEDEDY